MGRPIELDQVDHKLIRLLAEDAGRSNNELAELVGLTAAPLSRRLARLHASGVIRRTVTIDPKALGLGLQVFVEVSLDRTAAQVAERFIALMRRIPEVVECHTVAGAYDFLLKIAVRDVEHYKRLIWNEFDQIAEIKTVRSMILLDSPKLSPGAFPWPE